MLSLHLPAHFDYTSHGFQFEENRPWICSPAIRYHLGVDGLSLWLVLLTTFLAPIGVLISWRAIETRTQEFYFLFLLQQTAMIGVFVALDLFLYYGFWELSLVPMAILIAMFGPEPWSTPRRLSFSSTRLFPPRCFWSAFSGSTQKPDTFDFVQLQALLANGYLRARRRCGGSRWLFWLRLQSRFRCSRCMAGSRTLFRKRLPRWRWSSQASSGSTPSFASIWDCSRRSRAPLRPLMIVLAVVGLLYGALVALAQTDMKRLVAFSILGNLSFCTLGIFCFAVAGLNGAVYQTINEGVTGGALLVLVALLYERYGTYDMTLYGGLAAKLPMLATLFVITSLALIGLPLFNGFIGEFLVLSGSFPVHPQWVAAATIGVILSASYMLWMVQRIFYGKESSLVVNSSRIRSERARATHPLADGDSDAGDGRCLSLLDQSH